MSRIYHINQLTAQQITDIATQLDEGAVAVFPTDTVYGIGTSVFQEKSISNIYRIKNRPIQSALQILISSKEQAQNITLWNEKADKLADAFWPGGLTLILPANEKGKPLLRGFNGLGLRVPAYAPLIKILQKMKTPLACTSANIHAEAVITAEEKIVEFFSDKVDLILLGGDLSGQSSSVLNLTTPARLLREGSVSKAALEQILGLGVE